MTDTAAPRRPIFVPALLTSALLYASHFPLNLGWLLGWIALVPLLTLVRHPGPLWRIYLAAYLSGVCFYTPVLRWLPTTDWTMNFAWAFLTLYGACYPVVGIWLLRWIDHRARWPLAFSVPLVWTALEYVKSTILTGFAWYLMAHTQHDLPHVIQIADLGGALLVSFLVLMVNGCLTELLLRGPVLPLQIGATAVALLATLGYGHYRLSEDAQRPGPVVALVQSNVAQGYRNTSYHNPGTIRTKVREHVECLTKLASDLRPDLIVWPETAIAGEFVPDPGVPHLRVERQRWITESAAYARECATKWNAALLLGLNSWTPKDGEWVRRNSGVYILPDGTVPGLFHKIHCVPLGEYPPFKSMAWMMPFPYEYSIHPGNDWPRFTLPGERGATFGVLICYEDTDPRVSRPYSGSDGKAPVNFLLTISNDGWFANSAEHAEHLAICRFRAVEARRSVARAVNQGISAVVDSNGRVLAPEAKDTARGPVDEELTQWVVGPNPGALPASEWHKFEVKAGVLLATVPLDGRTTLYARWGDWLPWACGGLALVGLLWRRSERTA